MKFREIIQQEINLKREQQKKFGSFVKKIETTSINNTSIDLNTKALTKIYLKLSHKAVKYPGFDDKK